MSSIAPSPGPFYTGSKPETIFRNSVDLLRTETEIPANELDNFEESESDQIEKINHSFASLYEDRKYV